MEKCAAWEPLLLRARLQKWDGRRADWVGGYRLDFFPVDDELKKSLTD